MILQVYTPLYSVIGYNEVSYREKFLRVIAKKEEEQLKRPRKLLLPPQNRQLRVEGSMHSPSLITRGVTQQFLRTIWVWKSSKWGLSRWFISPVKIRTVIRWKANCML